MNDLVSKSAVLKAICTEILICEDDVQLMEEVYDCIEKVPTIDLAKHGQWDWLQYDENNPKNGNWHCSKCNLLSLNKSLYCPRCGARMDGEAE